MGLCWEEPSPNLCNTFAGRPWPVALAGDSSRPALGQENQEGDPAPLVPRVVLVHPTSLSAFF